MSTIKQTLVEIFNLENMSPEKAGELVERLGKMVFQAVLVRVLPTLSEEEFDEYEKIVEGNQGGEMIFRFLSEKVPTLPQIIEEEAKNLRDEMAEEFAQVGA